MNAKRACKTVWLLAMMAVMGCDGAGSLFGSSTVTVQLVNNSDHTVTVTIFIADQQDIPEFGLTSLGDRIERTVQAGATDSFTRDCDDLQAIIVDNADLEVPGGLLKPDTSSQVLRDGTDFSCGDSITFTFDHSALLVDFDVTVLVSP